MTITTLLAAGSNARGQLGIMGTEDAHEFTTCRFEGSEEVPVGTARVLGLASGANHTLVILERNRPGPEGSSSAGTTRKELWGCGEGKRGQLAKFYATETNHTSTDFGYSQKADVFQSSTGFRRINLSLELLGLEGYEPVSVAAAWETSYVVLSPVHGCLNSLPDVLLSMGSNDFGDLGIGEAKYQGVRLDGVPLVVDLGTQKGDARLRKIEQVNAGTHHVVLWLTGTQQDVGGVLLGWGVARHGQLGEAHRGGKPLYSPKVLTSPFLNLNSAAEANEPPVIALGNQHTAVLAPDGTLHVSGANRHGQCDVHRFPHGLKWVGATWGGTFVKAVVGEAGSTHEELHALGSGTHGQLGGSLEGGHVPLPQDKGIHHVVCGSEHVLAILGATPSLDEGSRDSKLAREVWGWGWNEHGNLGDGTTAEVMSPKCLWRGNIEGAWAGCGSSWIGLGKSSSRSTINACEDGRVIVS